MGKFNNIRTDRTRNGSKFRSKGKKDPVGIDPRREEFTEHLTKYNALYIFSCYGLNKRNLIEISNLKEWSDSEMWYCCNAFLRRSFQLLISKQSKWRDLEKLYSVMTGSIGLLFTNCPQSQVEDWFKKFSFWDYPRGGYEVSTTVTLKEGPLAQFRPEIEPYLRQLGMPTAVVNGKVILTNNFEVCKEGNILTSEQVHFLELLGEKLSVFKLKLKGTWTKETGYQELKTGDGSDDDEEHVKSDSE